MSKRFKKSTKNCFTLGTDSGILSVELKMRLTDMYVNQRRVAEAKGVSAIGGDNDEVVGNQWSTSMSQNKTTCEAIGANA